MLLLFQAPAIPDKITDQGLLLAAFILLLSFLAVMGIIAIIGKYALPPLLAKFASNGGKSYADALARFEAELRVLGERVNTLDSDLRADYHDRLVPSQERLSLALIKLRLVDEKEFAEEEDKRLAGLGGKSSKLGA